VTLLINVLLQVEVDSMVPIWVIKEMDKIWLIKVLLELIKEELISEINLIKEELIKEINLIKKEPISEINLIKEEPTLQINPIKEEPISEINLIKEEPTSEINLIKEEPTLEINLIKEVLISEINPIKEEPTLVSSIPLIQLTETELMDKVFRMLMDNSEDSEMDLVKSSDSDKDSQTLVLGSSN
jgi:hypothetical protein